MNETLKRRLIGLLLIILALFILSLILPKPGEMLSADENVQRITLDIQASAVQSVALPPISSSLPPVIEAAQSEPPQIQKTGVDTVPDIEEPPLPIAVSTAEDKPASLAPVPKVRLQPPSKPAVAARKDDSTPSKPASAEKRWYVQLGAFSDIDNARQLLQKFKAQKYSGIVSPADTPKGTRYRVRIGPYVTRERAADAQKRMIKIGVAGTTLIEG